MSQVKSVEQVQKLREKLTLERFAEMLKAVLKSYDKIKKIAKALQGRGLSRAQYKCHCEICKALLLSYET